MAVDNSRRISYIDLFFLSFFKLKTRSLESPGRNKEKSHVLCLMCGEMNKNVAVEV